MAICHQNALDGIRDSDLVLDDQDSQRTSSVLVRIRPGMISGDRSRIVIGRSPTPSRSDFMWRSCPAINIAPMVSNAMPRIALPGTHAPR